MLFGWSLGLTLVLFITGCGRQAADEKDTPITGRRSDPPVQLRAEWKPDRRYLLRVEAMQSMELPFPPGSKTAQDTMVQQDYSVTVTNAGNGRKGLEMEVTALVVQAHFGDQVVLRFDSLNQAVPNEGPGVEFLQRIIGGRIQFLLGTNNQVEKTTGIQELLGQMQGGGGNRGPGLRGNLMGGALQRMYGEDYFKQIIEVGSLPNTAVRVGDTWSLQREIDVGLAGQVAVSMTNTLRGWQEREGRKCARIEFQGTLTVKTNKVQGGMGLVGLALKDGRVSGKSWFDPALGLPVESAMEQSCQVTGTLPNFGRRGPQAGQSTNSAPTSFASPWRQSVTVSITVPGDTPSGRASN
jgi:hypothetical protein